MHPKLFFTLLFVQVVMSNPVLSQNQNRQIEAKKINVNLKIDGELLENEWNTAQTQQDFKQHYPFDSTLARSKTAVKILFNEDYLYIAAICTDNFPQKPFVVNSLKRDFEASNSDLFAVYLETFNDGQNAFFFTVNPYGVQREGLISGGGEFGGTDASWDNIWFVETKQLGNAWTVEMAIPFKTLRYKAGESQWKVNFVRADWKQNERSIWNAVPRNFRPSNLAFTGILHFQNPLPSNHTPLAFIPYAIGGTNTDRISGTKNIQKNIGFDAKVGVGSALNLDLTVNPDFSQVEVDRQVTNLSRFELFFPERRQFFVENSDLFSNFGFSKIKPFFSRRIGVGRDPYTGQFKQNRIWYGARLSGKLNDKLRIGAMNMETAHDTAIRLPSVNYSVVAFQQQVFARSNVGFIFVNKQITSDSVGKFEIQKMLFNRVAGIDYNLASKNGHWLGKAFYHHSFSPNTTTPQAQRNAFAHAVFLGYTTERWNIFYNHELIGNNYNAEVGYILRKDVLRLEPSITYIIYPKTSKTINNIRPFVGTDIYLKKDLSQTLDQSIDAGVLVNFQNTSSTSLQYRYDYTYLYFSFDPTNSGATPLPDSTTYRYQSLRANYQSSTLKPLNFNVNFSGGQYFNGFGNSINATVNYRFQPYATIGLFGSMTDIRLPEPYNSKQLYLVGPRCDVSFNKNVFLTTTFQYNTQINNFNTNIRFQWRFRPVSDLFIVYSDNYFANSFVNKNRGVVVKFTYWLNK